VTIKDLIIKRRELALKLRPLPPSPARTRLAKILSLSNDELIERFVDTYLSGCYGITIYGSDLLPVGLVKFDSDDDFFHCLTDILKLTVKL